MSLNNIPEKHNVGLFYPKICSDILYAIFGKFAEGKSKAITNQIKYANNNFKIGLIRAFFDDEGSIRSDNHTVIFHKDNKELLKDIIQMINEFGISTNDIKSYEKREKLRYYFTITGTKNISNSFLI